MLIYIALCIIYGICIVSLNNTKKNLKVFGIGILCNIFIRLIIIYCGVNILMLLIFFFILSILYLYF
jgi:hypothetical protein